MKKISDTELKAIIDKHAKWLRGADGGERADLYGANLRGADLRGADLYGADLRDADLYDADLRDAKNTNKITWNAHTAFYPLQCPETGAFIGYKKAAGKIVMLEICADAKRSSATSRKCRCSKAKVLGITNLDGSESGLSEIKSDYDKNFIYRVGETVEVPDFNEDRWSECTAGIHFFITREEAVKH
nr:MAG TPA: pentapeptide repeat protein [Bacteriophage sp.]